tara:strand:+ start:1298 stop:1534 length:237 start_codon:yes stop_codon:yes gene_type:complete
LRYKWLKGQDIYIEKINAKSVKEYTVKMQVKDSQNTKINIEDRDVKKRDPFYKEKAIHYVHKNKRKYNRKNKHKQSDV